MIIQVNTHLREIHFDGQTHPCRIGRDGAIAEQHGQEGDFKTPLGTYILRYGFYRADRLPKPPCALPFWPIRNNDGWCDDPSDVAYNQTVRLPYPASAESLIRDDPAYDIIIVLGHNDSPPQAGKGSAIFLHVTRIDDKQTAGCVAVSPEVMAQLLPKLSPGDAIKIN